MFGEKLGKMIFLTGIIMLASIASLCQPANEGYDPMLQITHQFAHPNLLLVLDVSGSMGWDMNGNSVGVDAQGSIPYWVRNRPRDKATSNPCKGSYRHTATLTKGKGASRMAIVKNALGNSVSLYEWDPTTIPESTWSSMTVNSGWVYWQRDANSQPIWYYCRNSTTSPSSYPFTISESTPGVISHPPMDLIGQTKENINWAVVT